MDVMAVVHRMDGWLAGIVEGEGSIGIIKRRYNSKQGEVVYKYPN